MTDLGQRLDESVNARIIAAIRELAPDAFKELAVELLEKINLRVTAAALADDVVLVEGEGREGKYLVMVSRRPEDASVPGLRRVKEKAGREGRLAALIVLAEMDKECADFAESNRITFADREKLLTLLRKYGIADRLLKDIDRRILESEGARYLPSIGRLDDILEAAESDIQHGRYVEALKQLDAALKIKPNLFLAWQRKAAALMALGQNEKALEACRKSLEIRPTESLSWYILGLILNRLGDLKGEIEAYDAALKLSPRMPSALINKGASLLQIGKLEEALKVFDSMLRIYPDNSKALNNRGLVLKAMGRTDEALQSFSRAIASDPSNQDALLNKAGLLTDFGSTREGIDAWKEVLHVARGRADLWMRLGAVQKSAGMFDEAAKSFAVAVALDPELTEAVRERDEALAAAGMIGPKEGREEVDICAEFLATSILLAAAGEAEESLTELDKCLNVEPKTPQAHLQRGSVLLGMGRLEEALAALKEGVREDPKEPGLLLDLEALNYRMGRREDCLRILESAGESEETVARRSLLLLDLGQPFRAESAAKAAPDGSPLLREIHALSLIASGKYQDAADELRELLRGYPSEPELLNNLGTCLRFAGFLESAEGVLREAIEAAPKYANAWNNLGCVLYLRGMIEEARQCFAEALLLDKRPALLLNMGVCQLGLNDLDGAEESFASSLRIEPEADALNFLGVVAERRKEMVKALELYEAALEKAPKFHDALANRDRVKGALSKKEG